MLAAKAAVKMALENEGAEVTALYVIEIPSFVFYQTDEMTRGMVSEGKGEMEKWLSKVLDSTGKSNIRLRTHVTVSIYSAYSEITRYAEEQGIDIILVGTKGRTGLKRLLLGSVASGVVTYAPCSVMVVR